MPAGDMFSSGGAATFRAAFNAAGGGAAGQAAGRAALARRYPTESANSRETVAREAYAGIQASRRLNRASQNYELDRSSLSDRSSYQRRAGVEGDTRYSYTAQVTVTVTSPTGQTRQEYVTVSVLCRGCLAKAEIEALVASQVQSMAEIWIRTSWRAEDGSTVTIDEIHYTDAARIVTP